MSLARLVYYGALVGGWAALAGWLVAEILYFRSGAAAGRFDAAKVGAVVGAAIGGGLSVVGGLTNAQWKQLARRAVPGLLGGALGGAVGTLVGDFLYSWHLPRAIGWTIFGLAIGVVDGLYERSSGKIRNGLVGGE